MSKQIMVKTDDPANARFDLVVKGKVDAVVQIDPATVSLSGRPGQTLTAQTRITPAQGYEFAIKDLSLKYDRKGIEAELVAPEEGDRSWTVNVTAHSKKADDLYNIINLKTDSPHKPNISIRVYAIYLDPS